MAAQIVDAQEQPAGPSHRRSLALAAVAIVLLVFAATLAPVQRVASAALGLAGLVPLVVTMSGYVTDDEGRPIAHAFVRAGQGRGLATTYTEETGSYRLIFSVQTRVPVDVSIGASGYEASVGEIRVASTDPRHDVRLHPLVRIDAGSAVHLIIGSDDGLCYAVRADTSEPRRSWPCRLLHVTVGKAGVLSVAVQSDDPRDRFGVSFAVGSQPTLLFATPCCAADGTARLPEGADALVQVVALDLESESAATSARRQGFTLRAALDLP